MPAPRPYGIGPYGTGPYSRYKGFIYAVGGSSTLLFDAKSNGVQRIILPWATTALYLEPWAEHFDGSWVAKPPCTPGVWTPADLCEAGGWAAPDACSPGTWAVVRHP